MAIDENQIQKMEAKLTKLRATLVKYGDLFNADGEIDTEEQRQIDAMQQVIQQAEERIAEMRSSMEEEDGTATQAVNISHSVHLIPQPSKMSCWAAGIAMLLGWKDNLSVTPETIGDALGYQRQMDVSGLHPEDQTAFNRWGLSWEAPMSYTVQGFADILANGPIWVASDTGDPHVRVVYGMTGDGTVDGTQVHIHDPSPINSGASYSITFRQLADQMGSLAVEEARFAQPIYVATIH